MTNTKESEMTATVQLSAMVESEDPIMFDHDRAFAEMEMRTVLMMNHHTLTALSDLATIRSKKERKQSFVDVITKRNGEVNG